jgi:hypothetical protein
VYGTDESWVASTPAVVGAGQIELARTGDEQLARAMVGGADWASQAAGLQPDAGLNWTATGDPIPAGFAAGADTRGGLDDWRNVFNPHSAGFWALASLLVVVGLLHIRLNTRFGPLGGSAHVG